MKCFIFNYVRSSHTNLQIKLKKNNESSDVLKTLILVYHMLLQLMLQVEQIFVVIVTVPLVCMLTKIMFLNNFDLEKTNQFYYFSEDSHVIIIFITLY